MSKAFVHQSLYNLVQVLSAAHKHHPADAPESKRQSYLEPASIVTSMSNLLDYCTTSEDEDIDTVYVMYDYEFRFAHVLWEDITEVLHHNLSALQYRSNSEDSVSLLLSVLLDELAQYEKRYPESEVLMVIPEQLHQYLEELQKTYCTDTQLARVLKHTQIYHPPQIPVLEQSTFDCQKPHQHADDYRGHMIKQLDEVDKSAIEVKPSLVQMSLYENQFQQEMLSSYSPSAMTLTPAPLTPPATPEPTTDSEADAGQRKFRPK